jgi:hypothetical protein
MAISCWVVDCLAATVELTLIKVGREVWGVGGGPIGSGRSGRRRRRKRSAAEEDRGTTYLTVQAQQNSVTGSSPSLIGAEGSKRSGENVPQPKAISKAGSRRNQKKLKPGSYLGHH